MMVVFILFFIAWIITFVLWLIAAGKAIKHNKPVSLKHSWAMLVFSVGMIITNILRTIF